MRDITDISVLVVSNDPEATKVLVPVFRAMNVTSLTVVTADEVPDYDHFDLAIISTNGDVDAALEAADAIRARLDDPRPHIVLLALNATEEKKRMVAWGRIDAIMMKPVTIAGITAQIECAIDRRRRAV